MDETDRARLTFPMGPLSFGFDEFVGAPAQRARVPHLGHRGRLRRRPPVCPHDAAALVVDNLGAHRPLQRPPGRRGSARSPSARPTRRATSPLRLSADGVELGAGEPGAQPDLELPAEAFCRLVYGRLDPDHTPAFTGDARGCWTTLRAVFPGP